MNPFGAQNLTRRLASPILAAVAIAATPGVARALPAPDEGARSHGAPSNARLEQQDRLAPKYVTPAFPPPVRTVESAEGGVSTEWLAGSVAAVVGALVLALAAAQRLLRHRRRHEAAGDGRIVMN